LSANLKSAIYGFLKILPQKPQILRGYLIRLAVRVFTGEAGEAFTLFLAVFALKPAADILANCNDL